MTAVLFRSRGLERRKKAIRITLEALRADSCVVNADVADRGATVSGPRPHAQGDSESPQDGRPELGGNPVHATRRARGDVALSSQSRPRGCGTNGRAEKRRISSGLAGDWCGGRRPGGWGRGDGLLPVGRCLCAGVESLGELRPPYPAAWSSRER